MWLPMNTSEVLQAVKHILPKLDPQTLKLWRQKGYLRRPTRAGLGFGEGLSENEWPDDTVDRITIIAEVCGQRATKKAGKALIAKGYFIGAAGVKGYLNGMIEDIINTTKLDHERRIPIDKKYPLFNEDAFPWMNLIETGFTLVSEYFDYIDDDEASQTELGYGCETNNIDAPKYTRGHSGFTRLIACFSIDQLLQDLDSATDLEIEQAFNNAANPFNLLCPIMAHYLGRDGYPPVTTLGFDMFLKVHRSKKFDAMTRNEFDCITRLFCVLGCMAISNRKVSIANTLPRVLTAMVITVLAPRVRHIDSNGVRFIPNTPQHLIDELNVHHTAWIKTILKIVEFPNEPVKRLETE